MSTPHKALSELLTADELEQIGKVCEAFESCWQEGQTPRAETHAKDVEPGTFRDRLLQELFDIEVLWRRKHGNPPGLEELQQRFPERNDLVSIMDEYTTILMSPSPKPGTADSVAPALPARYIPEREIARGGMGVVWHVTDQNLARPLAVKVMHVALASRPGDVARFEREAQLTGTLQHPAIPPVVEFGQLENGSPFFSMKLVIGRNLREMLTAMEPAARSKELPRLIEVFTHACQGVAFAHSVGVIHRDLKSANIMVGAFGEVQVMDWGMAKTLNQTDEFDFELAEDCQSMPADAPAEVPRVDASVETQRLSKSDAWSDHTEHGTIMGTPAYMPPEQARGDVRSLDRRTDVFSLGAILAEILTGAPPYPGKGAFKRAFEALLSDVHERLDSCSADGPLVELCKRCLAADPAARPADAAEVAAATQRWINQQNNPLFRLLDTDGDGHLSPSELQAASSLLAALDKDNDGKVSLHECGPGELGESNSTTANEETSDAETSPHKPKD